MRWWDAWLPDDEGARPPLIVLCGATAVGKSDLAIRLCDRIDGLEIVGADSRQVYRGMDIGTDKVAQEVRARVPHHCLDLVTPDEPFTVADYVRAAGLALADIASRGGRALLVGGTGLYLRAVVRGVPVERTGTDAGARRSLEEIHTREGLSRLVEELRRVAPRIAAATDLANPRRVIRALERVAVHGDRPLPAPRGYPAPSIWLGLSVPPPEHRARIDSRAARQFRGGLPEEAADLKRRYGTDPRAFSAFGYREAFAVLAGDLDIDDAIATTARRTWSYARRQRTWFRAEPGVTWLDPALHAPEQAAASLVDRFLSRSRLPAPSH